MDFQDIKLFKDIYLIRNLTEVSKRNHISQPAISYRLAKLQEELNSKLYEYRGTYHFNEKGKLFFEFCSKILSEMDDISEKLSKQSRFQISLSEVAVKLYLPKIYQLLSKQSVYPIIRFTTSENAIKDILENKSLFVVIGGANIELPRELRQIRLRIDSVRLVFNKALPDQIESIPIIQDEPSSGLYTSIEDYLSAFQNVTIRGEIGTAFDKLDLVRTNRAGTFISDALLSQIDNLSTDIKISRKYYFERSILMLYHKLNEEHPIIQTAINKLNSDSGSF